MERKRSPERQTGRERRDEQAKKYNRNTNVFNIQQHKYLAKAYVNENPTQNDNVLCEMKIEKKTYDTVHYVFNGNMCPRPTISHFPQSTPQTQYSSID